VIKLIAYMELEQKSISLEKVLQLLGIMKKGCCKWECNNVPKMGMKSVPPPQ
jgi:hypothetical protein